MEKFGDIDPLSLAYDQAPVAIFDCTRALVSGEDCFEIGG